MPNETVPLSSVEGIHLSTLVARFDLYFRELAAAIELPDAEARNLRVGEFTRAQQAVVAEMDAFVEETPSLRPFYVWWAGKMAPLEAALAARLRERESPAVKPATGGEARGHRRTKRRKRRKNR